MKTLVPRDAQVTGLLAEEFTRRINAGGVYGAMYTMVALHADIIQIWDLGGITDFYLVPRSAAYELRTMTFPPRTVAFDPNPQCLFPALWNNHDDA